MDKYIEKYIGGIRVALLVFFFMGLTHSWASAMGFWFFIISMSIVLYAAFSMP